MKIEQKLKDLGLALPNNPTNPASKILSYRRAGDGVDLWMVGETYIHTNSIVCECPETVCACFKIRVSTPSNREVVAADTRTRRT